MTRSRSLPALLVVLAFAVLPVLAAPDLRSLSLHLSDLPSGTTPDTARYWTNVQAASRDRVPFSVYRAHGRLLSYSANFSRLLTAEAIGGLLGASDEITEFRSAAGARWGLLQARRNLIRLGVPGTTTGGANTPLGAASHKYSYRPLRVPRVGGQTLGLTSESCGDEFCYTNRVVLFREGDFVALLRASGLQDRMPVLEALRLARVLDRRITSRSAS